MIAAAIGVFVAAVVLDFATARYMRALALDRMHAAGLWSVVMGGLSAAGLLALVDVSRWMLIPEFLGLYVGTRLAGAVRRRALGSDHT